MMKKKFEAERIVLYHDILKESLLTQKSLFYSGYRWIGSTKKFMPVEIKNFEIDIKTGFIYSSPDIDPNKLQEYAYNQDFFFFQLPREKIKALMAVNVISEGFNLGQNFRVLRVAKGITQKEVAIASGLSFKSVNAFECNRANCSIQAVEMMAIAIGVRLSFVI